MELVSQLIVECDKLKLVLIKHNYSIVSYLETGRRKKK